MLETPTLAKALVGAEASYAVSTVKYREPTAGEKAVAFAIADEVGRIESRVSVMLAHIEGHYESQVANLKLRLVTQKFLIPALIGIFFLGAAAGFVIGKII